MLHATAEFTFKDCYFCLTPVIGFDWEGNFTVIFSWLFFTFSLYKD
jgi:hypothetical protein